MARKFHQILLLIAQTLQIAGNDSLINQHNLQVLAGIHCQPLNANIKICNKNINGFNVQHLQLQQILFSFIRFDWQHTQLQMMKHRKQSVTPQLYTYT